MYRPASKIHQLQLNISDLNGFELIKLFISGAIGLFISIFASAIVNTTLVEISLNIIFAFYFGICFLSIGLLLFVRISQLPEDDLLLRKRPYLFLFSSMVLLSGIFCFFLEENWFMYANYKKKVPLYILIAISLNFCIIFSIIDLLNFCLGFCQKSWQKTMVETPKQIVWVLSLSILMGMFYGFAFGIFDLEDAHGNKLDIKLIQEEYYCLPFAGTIGFLGGVFNEYMRMKGDYLPFQMGKEDDPFNEEI